jgi:glutamate N-acetyltransferase/amino-acid N-acetyltransferase
MSPSPVVAGFRFAGVAAGIKKGGALDLALAAADAPVAAAGAFTRNAVRAAPVEISERHLRSGLAQAVIVNSGCANACSGSDGMRDAEAMAGAAARALDADPRRVLVCSTGVIGLPLPMNRIRSAIPALHAALAEDGLTAFAEAIRTTDTFPKVAAAHGRIAGRLVSVAGSAKGAGMIAPRMATMLAFLFTDAAVNRRFLRAAWRGVVEETFNAITVDGDTSTNDTALLLASGRAGNPVLASTASRGAGAFLDLLRSVASDLAEQIVRDGEGATRVVEVLVDGARTPSEAAAIARRIAESPLVKTALYGADPNWGRIAAAVGNAVTDRVADSLNIAVGDVPLVRRGREIPHAAARARAVMLGKRYALRVSLGRGRARARMLTCDLTEGYIEINAHYRS